MREPEDGVDASPVAGLPIEIPPPPELEERVVERLAARGGIRRPRASWWLPLAASLVGLIAGWSLRGAPRAAPSPVAEQGLFLLLLSEDPLAGPPEKERVRLYAAWAGELAQEGRLESAKKLAARGVIVRPGAARPQPFTADPSAPSGFFLVHAGSLDEAVELARQSPHARLGGRVTVRPIDPV